MRDKRTKPILIFIILLAALYVIIYVLPRASVALRSTYVVEYGELKITDETEAYLVKDEQVYFAGKGGRENRYIKEGRLVRKGTRIMELKGKDDSDPKRKYKHIVEDIGDKGIVSKSFKAGSEGVVSYNADGYEATFTPKNIAKKKKDDFRKLDDDDNVELARKQVSKGDPVFKIVDRSGWYLVCYIDEESKNRYSEGEKLSLEIDGSTIAGTIASMSKEDREIKMVIKTNYYYKDFATRRVAEVTLIASDQMGLVIQNSSIGEKKGNQGVYVRQKNGKYKFTRINVLSTDGKQSVISKSYFYDEKGEPVSTVKTYDEVLRKAS